MRFHRGTPVVAVLAALLAGCTAAPAPTTTADGAAPVMPDPVVITGTGSANTPLEIPEGALSLRVDLACSNGGFVVSAGGDLAADRGGQCGGVSHFVLPLPDFHEADVSIRLIGTGVGDGDAEVFAARVAFSPEAKFVDAAIVADCEDLGAVYTAIANAEEGFANGLDPDGWAELVSGAVDRLEAMTPSPLLAPQVATMHDWLAAASEPGTLYTAQPVAVRGAQSVAGQLCVDNGTAISIRPGSDPGPGAVAPSPVASADPDTVTITGTGSQLTVLDIPDGAQSLRVALTCSSGTFVISAGGDLGSDRSGRCGGTNHVELAVPDAAAARVDISMYGNGEGEARDAVFAATVAFSSDPKTVDPDIAADCDTLGIVYTAIADADAGYQAGDLDAAAWADTLAEGNTRLAHMIDRTPSPMTAPQVEVLATWLRAATDAGPGIPLQGSEPVEVQRADGIIGQVCTDNGSTITVTPAYGG